MIKFFVPGRPRTKGSMRFVPNKHTGRPIPLKDKNLESWVARVMVHATMAMNNEERFVGPLKVTCMFFFQRPQSHFGTGRNSHLIKSSAPQYPSSRSCGDVDKLARAVFDALTDIAYDDDSQVIEVSARKGYCTADEGAWIYVEEIEP